MNKAKRHSSVLDFVEWYTYIPMHVTCRIMFIKQTPMFGFFFRPLTTLQTPLLVMIPVNIIHLWRADLFLKFMQCVFRDGIRNQMLALYFWRLSLRPQRKLQGCGEAVFIRAVLSGRWAGGGGGPRRVSMFFSQSDLLLNFNLAPWP